MILDLKCVLHVDDNYNDKEKIIAFTQTTLETCNNKKAIRIKIQKRASKYDNITLPTHIDGSSGYHPQCYKYFCSVKEKKVKASCKYFLI